MGDSPSDIRERIPRLKALVERCYMHLARDLWTAYHRKLYVNWGFETFDDYVKTEVGISKDYAYRMRRIFSVFVLKCGIKPSELDVIGRSKAQILLPVIDKSNAKGWISTAKLLPYNELVEKVHEIRKKKKKAAVAPTEPDNPLPNGDQPIRLAKNSTGIALKQEEFKPRTFRLPADSDSLLDEALAEAQRITKSSSEGFNLTMIAQHFMAHRMTQEGKKDGRLHWFMRHMEKIYGGHLIHVKDDKGWEILAEAAETNPKHLGTSAKERISERDSNSDEKKESPQTP